MSMFSMLGTVAELALAALALATGTVVVLGAAILLGVWLCGTLVSRAARRS
ncbi:MAG: hypothetical protein ACQEWM_04130 [Actinomycetota bacterium]